MPQRIHGPFGGAPQQSTQLAEGQFDRIQIRTIGRQIQELSPDTFDRFLHAPNFVRGQIIQDEKVSRLESWSQMLADVVQE